MLKKHLRPWLMAGSFLLANYAAAAPMPYHGGLLIESFNNPAFNSMGNTTGPWVNGETVRGWYSTATHITFGFSGAMSDARMYGLRFDSSGNSEPTAGSLGTRTTPSSGPIHYALALVNETDEVIEEYTLTFSAFIANFNIDEGSPDRLSFSYKVGGAFGDDGFTEVPELLFETEGGSGQGVPVAGTARRLSATVTGLSWAPGEILWLRWTDHHDETFGGVGMGIDHLYFETPAANAGFYHDWEFDLSSPMIERHVDQQHPNAADTNPGTRDQPLLTIQGAINLAQNDTAAGNGTHIIIHPGVYREVVDITSRFGNRPLIIEAAEPGTVTLSGSDIFADWTPVPGMENVYSHPWPFKFGWQPNPWPGDLALRYPEGTRRELLFIDKEPMTQVVRADELAERTYLVDEANERILLSPPLGVNPNQRLTEVSVRPENLIGAFSKLIRVFRVNNVWLRGFTIEHSASGFSDDAAIAIRGSSNIIVEDMTIIYNDGVGLSISSQGDTPAANVIVRNTITNFNGTNGMTAGGISNMLVENGEASFNNWRGALWGATGWAPCGFKFAYVSGMIMRDYLVTQNHASGGWMDDGNRDILFERFHSVNNFRAGLSLEANFGPIVIRDSIFYGNTVGINGFDNSGVLMTDSLIFNNSTGQIRMAGSTSLTPEELEQIEAGWRRNRQARRHIPRDWHLENNFIGMTDARPGQYFFEISVRGGAMTDSEGVPRYIDFPDTFTSLNNAFFHPAGTNHTGFPNLLGIAVDFPTWVDIFGVTEPNTFIDREAADDLVAAGIATVGLPLTYFTGAVATAPVVEVEVVQPFAIEADGSPAYFRISRREGDSSIPLMVAFALESAAEAGTDFADPGLTVQIEANETEVYIPIVPLPTGTHHLVRPVTLTIEPDLDGNYRLNPNRTGTVYLSSAAATDPASLYGVFPLGAEAETYRIQLRNPANGSPLSLATRNLGSRYTWRLSSDIDGPVHTWTPLNANDPQVAFNWVVANRDGISNAIPLGFEFSFFGETFSSVYVHSNGFVTFTPLENPSSGYGGHVALPNETAAATANMIAGFWTNLTLVADSRVRTRAAGDRFIIEYHELNRFPSFGAPQRVRFQIILHESGVIDLVYDENSFTANLYSIGLQGGSGTEGLSVAHNQAFARPGLTVRLWNPDAWLQVSEPATSLAAGASTPLDVSLRPGSVDAGIYEAMIEVLDPSDATRLFLVPVHIQVGDVYLDVTETVGNWHFSPVFGWFYADDDPWIYTQDLEWIYLYSSAFSNIWYWQPATQWNWSHHRIFPVVWNASSDSWQGLGETP